MTPASIILVGGHIVFFLLLLGIFIHVAVGAEKEMTALRQEFREYEKEHAAWLKARSELRAARHQRLYQLAGRR